MPLAAPLCSSPSAWTDIALLDAPAVHVHLGEQTPVAIGAERPHNNLARRYDRAQPLLCCPPTRLVELCRIDVRQANLLPIAYQGIAVDGETALARVAGKCYGNGQQE